MFFWGEVGRYIHLSFMVILDVFFVFCFFLGGCLVSKKSVICNYGGFSELCEIYHSAFHKLC